MPLRRLVSFLLLATFFAIPLDAGPRRRAVRAPGVTADALGIGQLSGASLAGTVAAVDGAVITLDTGGATPIRIDAAGATIVAGDQVIQTVADVVPGARITAFVESGAAGGPLLARLVVIESRPPLMVAGEVEAIDLGASTFTILGITIAVDDDTQFDTAFPTFAPMRGLIDLDVGNFVKVDAELPGDRLLATRVLVVTLDIPQLPVMLRGVVESMSEREWVISSRDGTETTILIDERTRIAGEPAAGDEVQVIAEQDGEGRYLALVIVRIGPIDSQEIEFRGWVNAIGSGEWKIGGPPGLPLPAVSVRITPETTLYSNPQVGDLVVVRGVIGTDLVVVASSIDRAGG